MWNAFHLLSIRSSKQQQYFLLCLSIMIPNYEQYFDDVNFFCIHTHINIYNSNIIKIMGNAWRFSWSLPWCMPLLHYHPILCPEFVWLPSQSSSLLSYAEGVKENKDAKCLQHHKHAIHGHFTPPIALKLYNWVPDIGLLKWVNHNILSAPPFLFRIEILMLKTK